MSDRPETPLLDSVKYPADIRALDKEQLPQLADELRRPHDADATLVITHFGPSLRSADPRYGQQASTACFCNDDDELIPLADVWLHGHLHCCHDYRVPRPSGIGTRVVCNARGLESKGEGVDFDPLCVVEV